MLIKLTRTNGTLALVNPLSATTILQVENHGSTVVNTTDSDRGLWVKETPEEIFNLQEAALNRMANLNALLAR